MMPLTTRPVAEVTAADRLTLEQLLDHAELLARQEAMKDQRGGILVTRHSPNRFAVAVTESVPFGTTRELSSW